MKALPCSHRPHQHRSFADLDRAEPHNGSVVALVGCAKSLFDLYLKGNPGNSRELKGTIGSIRNCNFSSHWRIVLNKSIPFLEFFDIKQKNPQFFISFYSFLGRYAPVRALEFLHALLYCLYIIIHFFCVFIHMFASLYEDNKFS